MLLIWCCRHIDAFSNVHSVLLFDSLKKKDSQRIWIFTNDDSPQGPDGEEVGRIQKQVQVSLDIHK